MGAWQPAHESSWFSSPALKFVVGIVLAILWVVYATAARRSLGGVGILLVVALCAGVIWLLVEQDIVDTSSIPALTHVALGVVAIVMAVGMSWSHVRRRISGQVDTDEVDG
jgi:peptidoglycan/LPS O-acetylase OafA/YrhL